MRRGGDARDESVRERRDAARRRPPPRVVGVRVRRIQTATNSRGTRDAPREIETRTDSRTHPRTIVSAAFSSSVSAAVRGGVSARRSRSRRSAERQTRQRHRLAHGSVAELPRGVPAPRVRRASFGRGDDVEATERDGDDARARSRTRRVLGIASRAARRRRRSREKKTGARRRRARSRGFRGAGRAAEEGWGGAAERGFDARGVAEDGEGRAAHPRGGDERSARGGARDAAGRARDGDGDGTETTRRGTARGTGGVLAEDVHDGTPRVEMSGAVDDRGDVLAGDQAGSARARRARRSGGVGPRTRRGGGRSATARARDTPPRRRSRRGGNRTRDTSREARTGRGRRADEGCPARRARGDPRASPPWRVPYPTRARAHVVQIYLTSTRRGLTASSARRRVATTTRTVFEGATNRRTLDGCLAARARLRALQPAPLPTKRST